MVMDKQFDTQQELNLSDDMARDLLDCEVVLIGGGESASHIY
jgi:hypothetical protein